MQALLGTEFAALLARADVSQAVFARLTGYTTRQVNNWCRARAAVPPWAAALAILLQDHPDPARGGSVQLARNPRRAADAGTIRGAWARLANAHHPDKGGTQEQMALLNAAYERAGRP
jgi:transcriptional regulator with XRE-family HTH domain